MSFRDCLQRAALRGAIKEGKLKEALDMLDDFERELKGAGVPDEMIGVQASQKASEEFGRQSVRKKHLAVLAYNAKQRIDLNLQAYRDGSGEINHAKAAMAMIENDGIAPFESYTGKKNVYLGRFHSMMQDFIQQYGKGVYGLIRHKDGLDNIGRELYGEKTGDANAAMLAKAITDTLEATRTTANSLGADIAKKERYGLPQDHNLLQVAKAGKQKWVEFILPKLDFARMRDTAGRSLTRLSAEERLDFLGKVWETIKTDGYIKAGDSKGNAALANRLSHRRVLEFKSFDDWQTYKDAFGDGDVFTTIINHIEHQSQQIAMLDVFGPNPTAMKQYLVDKTIERAAQMDASTTGGAKKTLHLLAAKKEIRQLEEMWNMANGKNAIVSNDRVGFTMAGLRNLITSAKLGSATLAAVPGDMVTVRMAKSISKLPGSDFIKYYAENLVKDSNRQLAVRLGLIADAATAIAGGQHRYMGDIFGPAWTRHVSDTVLRLNGLTAHTQAARWAHGMEWLGYFADNRGKVFDDLEVKDALRRAGITQEDWNTFRATPLYEHEGATFLRPDDVLEREDLPPIRAKSVADKFMMMVMDESSRAIPSATLRARVSLLGESKPGTLSGELLRSFAMFKNFPVTLLFLLQRGMILKQGMASKAAFAATMGLTLTLAGAFTVQMQQLAKGRDPINMNPTSRHGRSFWGQAALTGGGMGIWGDFLFRDANRFGGGLSDTLAGPVASFATDVIKLGPGTLMDMSQGKDANLAPKLLQFVRNNMPGSNIWYARLVLQNGIMDAIQKEIDPEAVAKWQRSQANYYRDYGQRYWWKQGNFTPTRPPDLTTVAQ